MSHSYIYLLIISDLCFMFGQCSTSSSLLWYQLSLSSAGFSLLSWAPCLRWCLRLARCSAPSPPSLSPPAPPDAWRISASFLSTSSSPGLHLWAPPSAPPPTWPGRSPLCLRWPEPGLCLSCLSPSEGRVSCSVTGLLHLSHTWGPGLGCHSGPPVALWDASLWFSCSIWSWKRPSAEALCLRLQYWHSRVGINKRIANMSPTEYLQ